VSGIEVEAQANIGRGTWVELAANLGRGRALDDEAALDDMAADTVSVGLRTALTSTLLVFGRVARYGEDDRPGPSEVAAPGHTNVDVGASWAPHPRLEVRGLVRNLLNQEYYASPDPRFVLAPGVNGAVTVVLKY
jgi:outer membrane receptor protein involved in Fe transport